MKLYPHKQPIILDDNVFLSYGGLTGTSTQQMREASYQIAEQQVSNYIDTMLLPTDMVGSADYFPGNGYIVTDYGYVTNLSTLRVTDYNGTEVFSISGVSSFARINEDTYGYIIVKDVLGRCGYSNLNNIQYPFRFEYTYSAGLPTGTANMPGMLMALTKAAQLVLNELYEVTKNESSGDVGVTEFSVLRDYSEKRKAWKNTVFGSSPKAAQVARFIDGTVKKARRAVMLGRF